MKQVPSDMVRYNGFMNFSLLHWNIWLDNQLGSSKRMDTLLSEFDEIIERKKPDCICLNEVLSEKDSKQSVVINHLLNRGYVYIHHVVSGPWNKSYDIGDVIISRHPLSHNREIKLGRHLTVDGFAENKIIAKAVASNINIKSEMLTVITAHLMHLRPHTLLTHFQHQSNLTKYLRELDALNRVILCGDFNEPSLMPFSFNNKNSKIFRTKTGTFTNPTWYKKARKELLLRANPDKILWSKNSNVNLKRFEIVQSAISDHRPIFASFNIK